MKTRSPVSSPTWPTPNSTDVVTVDVGAVALAPGSYLLFMTNPDSLGIAAFAAPDNGGLVFVEGSTDPLTGDTYSQVLVENAGVSISGVIPEASTWAMMLLGFAGLARRRTRVAATRSRKPGGRIERTKPISLHTSAASRSMRNARAAGSVWRPIARP